MTKHYPDKGDIVWIDMNPQLGHEQAGRRPAIIMSPLKYNSKVGLALVCPITSHIKGYPFEVVIPDGFKVKGAILADQIRNVDWTARNIELIFKAPQPLIDEVQEKINAILNG